MIISVQKPFEEIMELLQEHRKVVLTGCGKCATVCKVGGEHELLAMSGKLKEYGKEILAAIVADTACNYLMVKRELREIKQQVSEADAILCLACGNGAQTVAKLVNIQVYPANNTMFIGEVERQGIFHEACKSCGDCQLGITGGICPVTRCAKSLLNGPCGGAKNGKCEVNPERDCAWILIYKKLKESNKLQNLEILHEARDYAKLAAPRTINIREGGQA